MHTADTVVGTKILISVHLCQKYSEMQDQIYI